MAILLSDAVPQHRHNLVAGVKHLTKIIGVLRCMTACTRSQRML